MGIKTDDDIPSSFHEKIKVLDECITDSEKFYCSDYTLSGSFRIPFCVKNIIGTNHARYAGKSWLEAFLDLDRGDEIIELYFENPEYYTNDLKKYETGSTIGGVVIKDNKGYIFSAAGGGNNRMITMKILYLAMIEGKSNEEINYINEKFTFYANVRNLPENYIVCELVDKLDKFSFKTGIDYKIINNSKNYGVNEYSIIRDYWIDTKRVTIAENLSEEELIETISLIIPESELSDVNIVKQTEDKVY